MQAANAMARTTTSTTSSRTILLSMCYATHTFRPLLTPPQRPRHPAPSLLRHLPCLLQEPLLLILQTHALLRHVRRHLHPHSAQALLHRHGLRPVQSVRALIRSPLQAGIRHPSDEGWSLGLVARGHWPCRLLVLVRKRACELRLVAEGSHVPARQPCGYEPTAYPGRPCLLRI